MAAYSPDSTLALDELRRALALLPDEQREALILVGAGGFSYEEVGEICGVATGTVKSGSRVMTSAIGRLTLVSKRRSRFVRMPQSRLSLPPSSVMGTPEIRYFFIRRPVLAAVISIVIVLLGIFALVQLPVSRYPQITPPSVQVTSKS